MLRRKNVLNALAKAGRENLFAVADAYNISVSEVLHVDNCTIKSLVWEHFVHTVNWLISYHNCILVYVLYYFRLYIVLLCIMYAFLYLCVVCVLLLQRINK